MRISSGIFLEAQDKVALRIRLEIERPADNWDPAASLKVLSRHRGGHIMCPIEDLTVLGKADVIDIGLQPSWVAKNTKDSLEGNANISFVYYEKGKDPARNRNIKIKNIIVSTERALDCGGAGSAALYELKKNRLQWSRARCTPDEGGLPTSIRDQAQILEDPYTEDVECDFEGPSNEDYTIYGSKEGKDFTLAFPFMVETETLTSLHFRKKFVVTLNIKGDATVAVYVNGFLQELDGGKTETTVLSDPMALTLEFDFRQLAY